MLRDSYEMGVIIPLNIDYEESSLKAASLPIDKQWNYKELKVMN